MDVVYNHTSQYDFQPLKFIDRKYYYVRDENGGYREASGCGNDFDSTKPMARRLIVDSIRHWMEEYHIDGFRFDLAAMIDGDTLREIRDTARTINPNVIFIAEPWGGGHYDPAGFSKLGYQSWNDIFRNGIKGTHPGSMGYAFGSWGGSTPEDYGKWMLGCVEQHGGPFRAFAHAVNYLESHDGYTLADFTRLALGEAREAEPVRDGNNFRRLSPLALRIGRLAAFMLFTARGAVMLHMGQEFGRSKVVAPTDLPGTTPGVLDHNSYEKDDATNWIDWSVADLNAELLAYYRGLVSLRASVKELRRSPTEAYTFLSTPTSLASGFVIGEEGRGCVAVLVNPNREEAAEYTLPGEGPWAVLVDERNAGTEEIRRIDGPGISVPAVSAMLLRCIAG
jgi:pullulanase/glycogen debranching enzyme